MTTCPCGSGNGFEICCGPVLAGQRAVTAEVLMRSRYSAFVRADLDYLQATAIGEAALKFNRAELELSLPHTEWLGLKIIETRDGQRDDIAGHVKFKVSFLQNGQLFKQTELSHFRKIDDAWYYCRGEIESAKAKTATPGRNDPCPCGSGRKYKKCCGA